MNSDKYIIKEPSFNIIKEMVDDAKGDILLNLDGWSLVKFYNRIGKYMRSSIITTDNKEVYLIMSVNRTEIKVVEYDEIL